MENGRTTSLPPCPEGAQPEIDDSFVSDDSTEVDDSVATEDPFSDSVCLPSYLPALDLDESNPDGIPDHSVSQIELFFSSRFCRVNVCQCHTSVTADDLERPTRGILCLQSFLDTQLPTQVQSAKLLLCMPKTFHVLWSKPVLVNGPNATTLTEVGDTVELGGPGGGQLHFRGTETRRTKFVTELRVALQKMRIHVSQDKSARKKAIKAYKKERKGKVNKKHISIPCEFAHVTQLTNRHVTSSEPPINSQAASTAGSLYA